MNGSGGIVTVYPTAQFLPTNAMLYLHKSHCGGMSKDSWINYLRVTKCFQ